ncbi:MAG: hypothetical protein OQK71_08295 [Desulfobacter sp.]|uniref:hypothetical protein n=1 Tax=uncultured Desulfobacter sp. TaxID=240139 RepID=UPI0029C89B75|nr:hypothetical protein [uncultured Desulfobacter sp.]MCW8800908.1 hypothetical protein [Desulfobacter sp.]
MVKSNPPFTELSMFDLRGKQSVRATFKLSQKAIDAIGLVAVHMGIKQKSLFDHIIEDHAALDQLAQTIRIRQFKQLDRKQKTFVLSRRTIEALTAISKTYNMPRDALVEYSIKKLESVIQSEKIRHEERKNLAGNLERRFNDVLSLYRESAVTLGEDDPFCRHLEKLIDHMKRTAEDVDAFLEKSKVLEDF